MSCVFAGTFDPITIGHERIINECVKRYGKVIVVIGDNPHKTTMFSCEDRKKAVQATFSSTDKVQVILYDDYSENYSEFLIKNGITTYVRGIRNDTDIEFENAYKKVNEKLYPFIQTVYIKADEDKAFISSTAVREMIASGKDYKKYVPQAAYETIKKILQTKKASNKKQ